MGIHFKKCVVSQITLVAEERFIKDYSWYCQELSISRQHFLGKYYVDGSTSANPSPFSGWAKKAKFTVSHQSTTK